MEVRSYLIVTKWWNINQHSDLKGKGAVFSIRTGNKPEKVYLATQMEELGHQMIAIDF